jgi:hypothetical protein
VWGREEEEEEEKKELPADEKLKIANERKALWPLVAAEAKAPSIGPRA